MGYPKLLLYGTHLLARAASDKPLGAESSALQCEVTSCGSQVALNQCLLSLIDGKVIFVLA